MITGNEPISPDPIRGAEKNNTQYHSHDFPTGLTIRQHFAIMAMQGCLASGFQTSMEKHAESAVEAADALINELNKKP